MGGKFSKVSQPHQHRLKHIHIELGVREACTGKDERETTNNTELIGGDIRGIITKALKRSLKEYKVYGQAIPPEILKPIRVLKVKKKTVMSVTPDNTGTSLTHGLLNTKYDLYAAVDSSTTPKSVAFLYQWEGLDKKILVTCPYSQDLTDGSIVHCAETDITNALKEEEKDRVKAVMEQLERIISGNSKWVMAGPDNAFSISVPGRKMFWGDIEGSRDIKLTNSDKIKLVMQLEVVLPTLIM